MRETSLRMRAAAFKEEKNVNIESKRSLGQMKRKGKRVPGRAREDEKKSMKNAKRWKVRLEDTKEGRQRQEESDEETDREGCRVK